MSNANIAFPPASPDDVGLLLSFLKHHAESLKSSVDFRLSLNEAPQAKRTTCRLTGGALAPPAER